jgi:hypothetical protein
LPHCLWPSIIVLGQGNFVLFKPMSILAHLIWVPVFLACGCGRTPSTTSSSAGTNSASLDEIAIAVKWDYYMKTPKTPPYFAAQPTIIPVGQLAGVASVVRSRIDVTNATYVYCNLSPAQWATLRAQSPPVYPIVWSPVADANGDRELATVDLATDVFDISTCSRQSFTNHLARMEAIIRRSTGQADFSLSVSNSP